MTPCPVTPRLCTIRHRETVIVCFLIAFAYVPVGWSELAGIISEFHSFDEQTSHGETKPSPEVSNDPFFAAVQRAQNLKLQNNESVHEVFPFCDKMEELASESGRDGSELAAPQGISDIKKAPYYKALMLRQEGESKYQELVKEGRKKEAQELKYDCVEKGLRYLNTYLHETRPSPEQQSRDGDRAWELLTAAEMSSEQAQLGMLLGKDKKAISNAHELSVAFCEKILKGYPNGGNVLQLAGGLMLRESFQVMTSPDDYLKRARELEDQVGAGLETISALLSVATELSQPSRSAVEAALAVGLMDIALESEEKWYPQEFKIHGGYNEALLLKGLALVSLGKLEEAQELLSLQQGLNPDYFKTMRSELKHRLEKARREPAEFDDRPPG